MAKNPTTVQRYTRLRPGNGLMGHAITAPVCGRQYFGVQVSVTPTIGMAQGRIVSISRGSPPPKKR